MDQRSTSSYFSLNLWNRQKSLFLFIRKHWRKIVVGFLLVALLGDLYMELVGVPRFVQGWILHRIQPSELRIEVDRVYAGFFWGIRFINPKLELSYLHGKIKATSAVIYLNILPLIYKQYHISFSQLTLEAVSDAGIMVPLGTVPILSLQYDPFNSLTSINFQGKFFDQIALFFDGIMQFMHSSGEQSAERRDSSFSSFKYLIQVYEIVQKIKKYATQSDSITVRCKVLYREMEKEKPPYYEVQTEVIAHNFLVYGVWIKSLQVQLIVRNRDIKITSVYVNFDQNESLFLEGTLSYGEGGTIGPFRGKIRIQMVPQRLLTFVGCWVQDVEDPQVRDLLEWIHNTWDFTPLPPILELDCQLVPLKVPWDFNKVQISGKISIPRAKVHKGLIRNFEASFRLTNGELSILRLVTSIGYHSKVDLRGVWNISQQRVFLEVEQLGPPTIYADFLPYPQWEKEFLSYFDYFTFNPLASPSLQFTIMHHGPKWDEWIIQGDCIAYSFLFNDIPVDQMEGSITIYPHLSLILIPRLSVHTYGSQATGAFSINLGSQEPYVQFNVQSKFPSQFILGLFHPSLKNVLSDLGFKFVVAPKVHSSGQIFINHEERNRYRVLFSCPHLFFSNLEIFNATADLYFEGRDVKGHFSGKEAVINQEIPIHLQEFQIKDFYIPHEGPVRGRCSLKRILISNHCFLDEIQSLFYLNKEILTLKDLIVNQGNIRFPDNYQFVFHRITASEFALHIGAGCVEGGNLHADQMEIRQPLPDLPPIQIDHPVISQFTCYSQQQILQMGGSTQSIHFPMYRAKADQAKFYFTFKQDDWELELLFPQLVVQDSWVLQNTRLLTRPEQNVTRTQLTIHRIQQDRFWVEGIQASLKSEGSLLKGESFIIRDMSYGGLKGSQLQGSFIALPDFISINTYQGNLSLVSETASTSADPFSFDITDIQSTVSVRNKQILIHNFMGKAYEGIIGITGSSDLTKERTSLHISGNNISLALLTSSSRKDGQSNLIPGLLSADAALHLVHQPNLQVYGNGTLKIRNAEIWRLPILSEFFNLLRLKVAEITKLSANLRFGGNVVEFADLKTDGALLSIQGKGYYWWETSGINFYLEANILRLGIFNTVLARQAIGTLSKYQWRTVPGKIYQFFTRDQIEDPALKENQ